MGDSPGDGLPLTSVHPNYTLTNLRPTGFEPQVTGIDWLPRRAPGRGHLGRHHNVLGEVWILGNVTGNTARAR